jgi:aminodeoxyfutalosine deaminase
MIVIRARWILPISERPLWNGWIALDRGRIAAVGRAGAALPFRDDAPLVDLGSMAVIPGLVNAHTHLELSWMHHRVPRAAQFTAWVKTMLSLRRNLPPPDAEVVAAINITIEEMHKAGTVAVGDISNTLLSVSPLRASSLDGIVFHEIFRLRAADADDVLDEALVRIERAGASGRIPVSLAPHAPYSVSPALFQGIRAARARTPFLPSSVHLAESPEEVQLLESAEGPWRNLLEELGAWDSSWVAPGCGPAEYLDRMGILAPRLLAVHGVQLDDPSLKRLRARGVTLVTCPRSNEYVGVGAPPVARFYSSGIDVAIGTDSLASNDDLNLFSELAALRRMAPIVPAASLLASATEVGARALGFESELGTIEPGRRAALLAIDLPADTIDVEEYLVSGIAPGQVRWVRELVAEAGITGAD